MQKKLIFLDIDGTLTVPGSSEPPESALDAIRRARANGHLVVLCSGRNRRMIAPLLKYPFDGFIASAGGYIEHNGQAIYDCPMTPEQQKKVLSVFEKAGVFRTLEAKDNTYTDKELRTYLAKITDESGNSELLRWRVQVEKDLCFLPMEAFDGEPIYKLVFMTTEPERLEEPQRLLSDEFQFCMQGVNRFNLHNGEVINRKFNKGTGVKMMCSHLGIPLEDTIAFGDSMNDYEMMETAALSICMGNGSEALKAISDEVCDNVENDGLYKAFLKHGLI